MRLYSADAMRAVDERARALGYPTLLLMEAAGRAVAEVVGRRYPGARVCVLSGKGNNGGDGFVAARWLKAFGHEVAVFAPSEVKAGDAHVMHSALVVAGVEPEPVEEWTPAGFDVVVDALFGTGLTRPLAGRWAELVERVNASGLPVVSVDLPSGLPYHPHIRARVTVALAGLKSEHLFYPHREACGEVWLAGIAMPDSAYEAAADAPELILPEAMRSLLPRRSGNAHKGSVGRVLLAGGYRTYPGALALAARGAYRAGAGLVGVAYPGGAPVMPLVEAVRLPVAEWRGDALPPFRADSVAVGMGSGPLGVSAARAVLELGLPTVIDADSIHGEVLAAYAERGRPVVVTPHPGEASRLLEMSPAEIAADPLFAARALAGRYPHVFVLKGGPTVIAYGDQIAVSTTGNPAMASGGMGDVLSGVIAAFLAAGLGPFEAAKLGVFLHGLAGDLVGTIGLLASEVADALPRARHRLEAGQVDPFWRLAPG